MSNVVGTEREALPEVEDITKEALRHITNRGFRIRREAKSKLTDLVLESFRALQEQRHLDVAAREDQEHLRKARANLDLFLDKWMEVHLARGEETLTVIGFHRTYAQLCPIYPCQPHK